MWCSGIPSSRTSHKEGSKIRPGCFLCLPAYPGSGTDSTIQTPEGQQAVCHHSQGTTTPWSRHDPSRQQTLCQKGGRRNGLERPALHATAGSPDGYHLAREPSDSDNNTEEELQDVESEEEPMVESDNSDTSSVRSGRASLRSQRSTTENRDRKKTRGRLRAKDSLWSMNAKKGIKGRTPDGKKSKVVLSMFRDSQKEGALEYADWRAEVEEYIKKGYEDSKIKDAMLFSLEGKACWNIRY